jgi:hypothetical protein
LEELSSLQELQYSYETNFSSQNKTEQFTEPLQTVIFSNTGASNGTAKVSEDEVIKVNVKWDDSEESFELHNKGK